MTVLSSLRPALAAGFFATFALSAAALAQPAPPAPMDSPQPRAMRPQWNPTEMRARRADHLRAVLQLQPSQDAALNAFLDAMKPPAGAMEDKHREEEAAGVQLTTPQRLDRMLARFDERRARFAQIAAATKQFYAQLSPSQQRAFDALHAGGMGRHHMAMMGGPMGDGFGQHVIIRRDGDADAGGPQEMGPGGPPPG